MGSPSKASVDDATKSLHLSITTLSIIEAWAVGDYTDIGLIEFLQDIYKKKTAKPDNAKEVPFDFLSWLNLEVSERFPDSKPVSQEVSDEILSLAEYNMQVVKNAITLVGDMKQRQKIYSAGGLLKKILSDHDPGFTMLAANAKRIREQQERDPTSVVDNALRQVRHKLNEMPPKQGPNVQGVQKLKALTDQGKTRLKAL